MRGLGVLTTVVRSDGPEAASNPNTNSANASPSACVSCTTHPAAAHPSVWVQQQGVYLRWMCTGLRTNAAPVHCEQERGREVSE
jgi:hypothetical protein